MLLVVDPHLNVCLLTYLFREGSFFSTRPRSSPSPLFRSSYWPRAWNTLLYVACVQRVSRKNRNDFSPFPWSHKVFNYTSELKNRKQNCEKSFAWRQLAHKFVAVSRFLDMICSSFKHGLITWETKVVVSLIPGELLSFVRPRELLSFANGIWHVLLQSKNLFELGGLKYMATSFSPSVWTQGHPYAFSRTFSNPLAVNIFAEISTSAKKWMVCGQTKIFNKEITDSNLEYNHSI